VLGFLAGYQLLLWFSKHGYSELQPDKVGDFIFGTAFWGVLVGGRLGYILFYDFNEVLHDPVRLFRVWEGGMASHGGILGIILYTYWYSRRHKVSWLGLGDDLVVAAPIGLFCGRIANFINGELYGRITTVPWAVQFPKEILENRALADRASLEVATKIDPTLVDHYSIVEAAQTSEPVRQILAGILNPRHPSQIYEALLEGVFLFVALWFLRTKVRPLEGVVTGMFFILYAILRIIGEVFREPDAGIALTWGLSRGQFLSIFMIAIGAFFIVLAKKRQRPSFHQTAMKS
jgi:phosphatidylglycerol:prolipoprotein diacylglycerol transferase